MQRRRSNDLKHFPRVPGVYAITNLANGKVYVGSTLCLRGRLYIHRSYLRRGVHENSYLQRAWDKYGEDGFRFEVLEECPTPVLLQREQHWMDTLKTCDKRNGYNLRPKAESFVGYRHTAETRAFLSQRMKGKDTSAMTAAAAEANRGRKRTPESVAKTAAGLRGKPKSAEHRAKTKANHWSKGPDAAEIAERFRQKLLGRKLSAEHRAKISAGNFRRWQAVKAALVQNDGQLFLEDNATG